MSMSRRMFLGGAIAAVGAVALPNTPAAMPTIYGDGFHDDWAGIDALWNGRPVRMLTDTVSVRPSGIVEMIGGSFRLSKTVIVKPGGPFLRIHKNHLTWTEPGDYYIRFENAKHDLSGLFLTPGQAHN